MKSVDSKAHTLLLLMLDLTKLKDKELILSNFLDELHKLWPDIQGTFSKNARSDIPGCFPIDAGASRSGYIILDGFNDLNSQNKKLIQNTISMLALLLEKQEQERILKDEKLLKQSLNQEELSEFLDQKTLRESQKHLSIMFNNISDALLLTKYDEPDNLQIVEVNQTYINTCNSYDLKITADDLRGKAVFDGLVEILKLDGYTKDFILKNYLQAIRTGKPIKFEESFSVSGKPYHSKSMYIPIYDEENDQHYVIYNSHDVTAEKEGEKALKLSEEKFRGIFEQSPIAIIIYNKDGKLIDVNRQTLDMFGIEDKKYLLGFDLWSAPYLSTEQKKILNNGHPISFSTNFNFNIAKKNNLFPTNRNGIIYIDIYAIPLIHEKEITGYLEQIIEVTDRKIAEEKILQSLKEKETLLRELYHRTKNNMYVIQSMLALHAASSNNEGIEYIVSEIGYKIQTMALVHQKLYQSQDLSRIHLKEYIPELANLLLQSFTISPSRIALRLDLEPISVLIDTAIPCGLILNELLSNACKHAFPDLREGEIHIKLTRDSDDQSSIILQVSDNGIGVPNDFDFHSQETLGLQSILMIAKHQLQGTVTFKVNNGVTCLIKFADAIYQPRV